MPKRKTWRDKKCANGNQVAWRAYLDARETPLRAKAEEWR